MLKHAVPLVSLFKGVKGVVVFKALLNNELSSCLHRSWAADALREACDPKVPAGQNLLFKSRRCRSMPPCDQSSPTT
eukprot:5069652-Amphidinium_carterae.2